MKHLYLILLLISLPSFAEVNLLSVKSCIDSKLSPLKNNNSITAAVVSSDKSEIMMFGNAQMDQLFEIGSITKTMTGTLLAKAVQDKKIDVSDPIPDIYQKPDSRITYEHLTTHTSGLTNSLRSYYEIKNKEFPYEGLSKEKFKDLYPGIKLDSIPGKKYSYSNTGVALLGLLLEDLYNKSFETLVQENIFNTLGMKDSYFKVPVMELHRFPQGNVNGKTWPHWDLFKTAFDPAGGARSTISDMVLYARANLNPQSTNMSTEIELAHTPIYQRDNRWMAMNWFTNPELGIIWHDGTTKAFNSILVISKKLDLAVVVMTDTGLYDQNGKEGYDFTLTNAAFDCLLPEN